MNPAPGSGKTTLAQEFCRRAAGQFRDVLWIACGEHSRAAIAAELAEQIGVHAPDDSADSLATVLEVAGRDRVLIVFDDVPPEAAVAERRGRASLLVTTRFTKTAREARVIRTDEPAEPALSISKDGADARLWRAMAACRPTGFSLELAARIAQLEPGVARQACARLVEERYADPFDDARGWYRLSARSIEAAGASEAERRRHCEAVAEIASEWVKQPDFAKQHLGEMFPAFRWAAAGDWPRAAAIARHTFALLRHLGRMSEGVEILKALRDVADERNDFEISEECSWELSWIRGIPYRRAGWASQEEEQLALDFGG